jgi:hypothetical protein
LAIASALPPPTLPTAESLEATPWESLSSRTVGGGEHARRDRGPHGEREHGLAVASGNSRGWRRSAPPGRAGRAILAPDVAHGGEERDAPVEGVAVLEVAVGRPAGVGEGLEEGVVVDDGGR